MAEKWANTKVFAELC